MSYVTSLGAFVAPPPVGGVLRSRSGWSYALTSTDLLWLARAAWAEGGSRPDATIWTLAQDLALHEGDSFTSFIRSYSQPVNPIWSDPSTPQCQVHAEMCTPAKIQHRLDVQSTPWGDIPQGIREKVTAFAQARLANPVPRAVEFADEAQSTRYLASHPAARVVLKASGNWYLSTSQTSSWPSTFVTVSFGGRVSTVAAGAAVVAALVFAAGAGTAYYAWRRSRRRQA